MYRHRSARRMPRARIDPIVDDDTARIVVESVLAAPRRSETVAVVLDHERRGVAIVSVDHDDLESSPAAPHRHGLERDDVVLGVAEWLIDAWRPSPDVGAVILASVRPGGGEQIDDIERWLTLDEMFDVSGIELVEWFVVGGSSSCPRTLVGEPDRWVP
ncbi:hypothetical protein [Ilumatobacter sp.]|uniref:hypothetical protein n=1 Tax=Ilumatobacter sp. TaxID=1967498 RepID=UPI003B5187BD